jgi:hypothetical protein
MNSPRGVQTPQLDPLLPSGPLVATNVDWVDVGEDVEAPEIWTHLIRDPAFECQFHARIGLHKRAEIEAVTLRMQELPITTELLSQLPLDRWLRASYASVIRKKGTGKPLSPWGKDPTPEARARRLAQVGKKVVDLHMGTREKLTDEFLAGVAQIYVNAGSKPIVTLEENFPGRSRSTLNYWVGQCRRRGFLPPANYDTKGDTDG